MDGLVSLPRLHVLVIEPDAAEAARLRQAIVTAEDDARVTVAARLGAGLAALGRPGIACVVTELELPDCRGLDVLRALQAARPDVPVVVATAAGSEEIAVAAMKLGAADYLRRPAATPGDVLTAIRCAAGEAVLSGLDEPQAPTSILAPALPHPDFVALTPRMRHALLLVERASQSRVPVLLEGETGTGKEVLARAIHARGPRPRSPFVVQNCGALSENLLESELFGHVRGAFTGADRERAGLFVEAGDGTVFLDEIGEAPLAVQVKLLRVLQHSEVKAVGADRTHAVRARIIAATNRTLAGEVDAGRFRRDLYYRLAVFPIRVPPLRQRAAEVGPLALRFLERFEIEERRRTGGFAPETLDLLARHLWPGNVRELEHEVHRLVLSVAHDQRIRPHHLAPAVREAARRPLQAAPLATLLARIELALIRQRLDALPTKTAAARSLGITREALYGKLKRLGAPTRGR